MENLPGAYAEPCYLNDTLRYVRKHNPFIYFDPIRTDEERCRACGTLTELEKDLASKRTARLHLHHAGYLQLCARLRPANRRCLAWQMGGLANG